MQMYRMKTELENNIWERKELVRQLNMANKERKIVEAMLLELEDEHDEAIVKIELLEVQVQDFKKETQRLKQVQNKAIWENRGLSDGGNGYLNENANNFGTETRNIVKFG